MPSTPLKLCCGAFCASLAILAAGCGGGGKSGAGLVAQADPICKQVAAKRALANAALHLKGNTRARELAVLAEVAPGIAVYEQDAVERLRALKPSAAQSRDWKKLLAGIEQLAGDTHQIAVAAKAKDYNGVTRIVNDGRALRQELSVIAARNGFKYCGITS